MKSLRMFTRDGNEVFYPLETINHIEHGLSTNFGELGSYVDATCNLLIIFFTDGRTATFTNGWLIEFV